MKQAYRHRIPQHFTASAVVICHGHILLVQHRRIGAWLPPGGHIEPYEMPCEAAVRETLEETAVPVEVVSEGQGQTGCPDAFFLVPPLCLHGVKAVEKGEELYHLDLAYLCRPVSSQSPDSAWLDSSSKERRLPPVQSSPDVAEARWVSLEELESWPLAANVAEIVAVAKSRLSLLANLQAPRRT